jgi:hypothetical protein
MCPAEARRSFQCMRRRTYKKRMWVGAIVLGVLMLALAGWMLDAARWATGTGEASGGLEPALG